MSEDTLRLPRTIGKAVNTLEKKFPELSERHCPSRQGKFCEITGRQCDLDDCPKMEKALEEYA